MRNQHGATASQKSEAFHRRTLTLEPMPALTGSDDVERLIWKSARFCPGAFVAHDYAGHLVEFPRTREHSLRRVQTGDSASLEGEAARYSAGAGA